MHRHTQLGWMVYRTLGFSPFLCWSYLDSYLQPMPSHHFSLQCPMGINSGQLTFSVYLCPSTFPQKVCLIVNEPTGNHLASFINTDLGFLWGFALWRWVFYLHVCLCTTCLPSTVKRAGFPWNWNCRWLLAVMWLQGSNLSTLNCQPVPLPSKPALQLLLLRFWQP